MNKRQIFKTIKSLEGFNKSIEHDSFEKSKKNADKPFQKYEFLGDRVLGLIISEYLVTTFSHNTLDEISRRFIHLVNTNTCLLYTSPSPRDLSTSRMPSSA